MKKGKGKASPKKKGSTSSAVKAETSQLTTANEPSSSSPAVVSMPASETSQSEEPSQPTAESGGSLSQELPPSLVSVPAELYLFNREQGFFVKQGDIAALIMQPPSASTYEYWLVAYLDGETLFAHRISSDMNQRWSSKVTSFTWNHESESGLQKSWCLRFGSEVDMAAFQATFTKAMWETLNNYPWEKAKVSSWIVVSLFIYLSGNPPSLMSNPTSGALTRMLRCETWKTKRTKKMLLQRSLVSYHQRS